MVDTVSTLVRGQLGGYNGIFMLGLGVMCWCKQVDKVPMCLNYSILIHWGEVCHTSRTVVFQVCYGKYSIQV